MKTKLIKSNQYILPNTTLINLVTVGQNKKNKFATLDHKSNIIVWPLQNKFQPTLTLIPPANKQIKIHSLVYSYNQTQIISANNKGIINIWDLNTQKIFTTFGNNQNIIEAIAIFKQQQQKNQFVTGGFDKIIKIWDIRQKKCVATFSDHTNKIKCIDISPDSSLLISGSQDTTVKIWDLKYLQKPILTYQKHEGAINLVKFNPQKFSFCSGSDRVITSHKCQGNNTNIKFMLQNMNPAINSYEFDQTGQKLYVGGNNYLKVWDLIQQKYDEIICNWKGLRQLFIKQNNLYGVVCINNNVSLWNYSINKQQQKQVILYPFRNIDVDVQIKKQKQLKKISAQNVVEQKNDKQMKKSNVITKYGIKNEKIINNRQVRAKQDKKIQNVIKEQKKDILRSKTEKDLNRKIQIKKESQKNIRESNLQQKQKNKQIIGLNTINIEIKQLNMQQSIDLQQFMFDQVQKQKQAQIFLINQVLRDTASYHQIINIRKSTLLTLLNQFKHHKNTFNGLNNINISILNDFINTILTVKIYKNQLKSNQIYTLIIKCKQMINDKQIVYIKNGIQYLYRICQVYKQIMTSIVSNQQLCKHDTIMTEWTNILKMERFNNNKLNQSRIFKDQVQLISIKLFNRIDQLISIYKRKQK